MCMIHSLAEAVEKLPVAVKICTDLLVYFWATACDEPNKNSR